MQQAELFPYNKIHNNTSILVFSFTYIVSFQGKYVKIKSFGVIDKTLAFYLDYFLCLNFNFTTKELLQTSYNSSLGFVFKSQKDIHQRQEFSRFRREAQGLRLFPRGSKYRISLRRRYISKRL